jgi:hypothetical protein
MDQNADGLLADPPEQLRAFINRGRITAMPAKRTRRRLLLNQVAQAFEPGRRYPEATVDEPPYLPIPRKSSADPLVSRPHGLW